jgi:hypothetical protein
MDDFDPIPKISPLFKGIVVMLLIWLIAFVVFGMCIVAVRVLA